MLSLKKRDIQSFLDTWGEFNKGGEHYMPTEQFHDFMKKLPAPLGYKGLNIEQSKLEKIIFCLNIRDHEGFVYFPEVMWAIFYSIIGKNDKKLHECKPMRNIMRKVKNKYTGLGRNTSLDMLCGNKFYRNEMTVTKYICGKVILRHLRILQKRSLEKRGLLKSGLTKTSVFLKAKEKRAQKRGFCTALHSSVVSRPADLTTYKYLKKQEKERLERASSINS